MADLFKIYITCTQCKGPGIVVIPNPGSEGTTSYEITCPKCNGAGELEWGRMEEVEPPDP
jgi:DnaJ-class molecular chaperone